MAFPAKFLERGCRSNEALSCQSLYDSRVTGRGKNASYGWRLPAGEIERVVKEAATGLLADRAALIHAARESGIAVDRVPGLLQSAGRWRGEILDLVERVHLGVDEIAIGLNLTRLTGEPETSVRHLVPARIKRRGVEMRLVLEGKGHGSHRTQAGPSADQGRRSCP